MKHLRLLRRFSSSFQITQSYVQTNDFTFDVYCHRIRFTFTNRKSTLLDPYSLGPLHTKVVESLRLRLMNGKRERRVKISPWESHRLVVLFKVGHSFHLSSSPIRVNKYPKRDRTVKASEGEWIYVLSDPLSQTIEPTGTWKIFIPQDKIMFSFLLNPQTVLTPVDADDINPVC